MYTIPKLTRRRLDITLLVIAIYIILAWLLTGCVGAPARDPLGTPAKTKMERPYPADYEVRAGLICRKLTGRVAFEGAEGTGAGFRCLDVGNEVLDGCVTYSDGQFAYTSPGCEEPN